jgi:hypothetical protein
MAALDRALVEHRQHAGQRDVDLAGLGVRLGAEGRARAGEDLRFRGELGVDFKSDDGFPVACQYPPGVRKCQSVASWYWCATLSMRASEK